jgi:PKD repeat protein
MKLFSILILITLVILGCNQSGSFISPQMTAQSETPGHHLLAYDLIRIDPKSLSTEIVPVHQAQTHFNVLTFLEKAPCTNCVKVVSLVPSGTGTMLINIKVTHPYQELRLTGFDVRGIAMFNGTHTYPSANVTTSDKVVGEAELTNADGFTSLYNVTTEGSGPNGIQGYQQGKIGKQIKPDSTLNGFKRIVSDDPANTRNAFFPGDSITTTYEVMMPSGLFVFGYAVDASWAPPIHMPVIHPMTDFGPDANCPEPWKLEIFQTPIGDGLTDSGGQSKLSINVYSWATGDFTVSAELPELFDSYISTDISTGSGLGYKTYELTIDNSLLAAEGDYKCLVFAINKSNPIVPQYIDLTAYQIASVHVNHGGPPDLPPVALAKATPTQTDPGMHIHFQDNSSYDPSGGSIVNYEWDWTNDGTFDDTGADLFHVYSMPGIYYVQLRVTNGDGLTGILDTPIKITINGETSVTWDNTISGMLLKACGHCHVNQQLGGVNLSTYDTMIASNVLVKGDPMSSLLYTTIYEGNHDGTLTSDQLTVLYNWILNNAPEN